MQPRKTLWVSFEDLCCLPVVVVSLSKKLYPNCSSWPSCIIGEYKATYITASGCVSLSYKLHLQCSSPPSCGLRVPSFAGEGKRWTTLLVDAAIQGKISNSVTLSKTVVPSMNHCAKNYLTFGPLPTSYHLTHICCRQPVFASSSYIY